ncbi:hypothetical protein BB561_005116 [Smittium simulii]|uniref:Uncharacterized protein n=1 Tax=Smittium simulii TaxID=133385 RepID=A0A2T9YC44_9FUNG|nr:hypothetical protein BB561_005116 [Smittium simulii]
MRDCAVPVLIGMYVLQLNLFKIVYKHNVISFCDSPKCTTQLYNREDLEQLEELSWESENKKFPQLNNSLVMYASIKKDIVNSEKSIITEKKTNNSILKDLISNHKDLFIQNNDLSTTIPNSKFDIKIIQGSSIIRCYQRRLSQIEKDSILLEINKMLDLGVVYNLTHTPTLKHPNPNQPFVMCTVLHVERYGLVWEANSVAKIGLLSPPPLPPLQAQGTPPLEGPILTDEEKF